MLCPGDFAPGFRARSTINPAFNFDTAAGRYVVISFFGSTQVPSSRKFLDEMIKRGDRLDVSNILFFGVTNDPTDIERLKQEDPGRIYFFDFDWTIARKFGALVEPEDGDGQANLRRQTFVLDQSMRVIGVLGMTDDSVEDHVRRIFGLIDSLPKLRELKTRAPVLIVPYVFDPPLCQRLIDYYETHEQVDSGFMRDVDGKTVGALDYSHKRRMDCEITDQALINTAQTQISRRIVPAIRQAYQFNANRIERNIVACYDAAQGAHFRAHRDNTTLGTAHRRFAVTINLNSEDYEGGEIWFPEFGPHLYKAPSGFAIVFSCSLMHEVPVVTRGKRYAFLPFLYDDAAAELRNRNRKYVADIAGAAGKVSNVCATTKDQKSPFSKLVIDGSPGCGNPEGCNTCLTSPTYQLGAPQEAKRL